MGGLPSVASGRGEPGLPFPRCSEHLGGPAAIGGCVLVLEPPVPAVSPCAAQTSRGGWVGAGVTADTADGTGRATAAPSIV